MLILCILVAIPILLAGLAATAQVTGIGRHSVPMMLARAGVEIALHGCDRCLPGARPLPGLIPDPPQYFASAELEVGAARRLLAPGHSLRNAAALLCDPGDTVEELTTSGESALDLSTGGTVRIEVVCNDAKPLRRGD
jgi:hypothetical protein